MDTVFPLSQGDEGMRLLRACSASRVLLILGAVQIAVSSPGQGACPLSCGPSALGGLVARQPLSPAAPARGLTPCVGVTTRLLMGKPRHTLRGSLPPCLRGRGEGPPAAPAGVGRRSGAVCSGDGVAALPPLPRAASHTHGPQSRHMTSLSTKAGSPARGGVILRPWGERKPSCLWTAAASRPRKEQHLVEYVLGGRGTSERQEPFPSLS